MNKFNKIAFIIISVLLFNSCNTEQETSLIDQKFENTMLLAQHRSHELFDVFNQEISDEESSYLRFLYAYMPLCDLADYNGDFYLKHVITTINAKNEISWGKDIPTDIFLHFVLPHRVNNENLDTCRIVFFNELKDRIKGLSMYDAAIEVNHWCHENVEYHPADGRTSSPLATLKTAFGRCGEESTFTVAALRSVCIPARQVYTPRWAHSDDNHAWVEAWIDGKWYFLGACEPEPVLNLGWFNKPASRAMLVHARVYGEYNGDEEINISTSQYDDINVIKRYAYTFKQFVKVTDQKGAPYANAKVEYQIYNYAEFYPITIKKTDDNGLSYLSTGLGELLIWVSDSINYGFAKVKIGEQDTVNIVMSNPDFANAHWELNPPPESDKLDFELSEEQIQNNKLKLQYEDSIRNAYVSSFISEVDFIKDYNQDLWQYVKNSRGNYNEIIKFIEENKNNEYVKSLLAVISEKDLRDTKADILNDHLKNSMAYANSYPFDIFSQYILNPRIELEMLLVYKAFLSSKFKSKLNANPEKLISWIKDSITINNDAQSYNLPITPVGVYNLRVSDARSRNIFFIAACRSLGIPARLETGTNTPQYFAKNKWVDVFFDGKPQQCEKFNVSFKVVETDLKFTPQYYHHFTLAKFDNNRFNTIELGEYEDLENIGCLQLMGGKYRLITSNRLQSGKILVDMKFFDITNDTIIGLVFPKEDIDISVKGSLDREKLGKFINFELNNSSNIIVAIIQPDKEPTKHVLNDIQKIKKDFENCNGIIVFIIQQKDLPATFKTDNYPNLPKNSIFNITEQDPFNILGIKINKQNELSPKVMIVNPIGEITYCSEGYKIGIGNDLLRFL